MPRNICKIYCYLFHIFFGIFFNSNIIVQSEFFTTTEFFCDHNRNISSQNSLIISKKIVKNTDYLTVKLKSLFLTCWKSLLRLYTCGFPRFLSCGPTNLELTIAKFKNLDLRGIAVADLTNRNSDSGVAVALYKNIRLAVTD